MKKVLLIIFISVCLSSIIAEKANCQEATIDTIIATGLHNGDVFNVPVRIKNMNNLGSIGVWISFDASVLTYVGLNTINPLITGATYNYDGTYIRFGWFDMGSAGINPGTSVLFNMQFKYKAGSTNLSFYLTKCVFADFTTLKAFKVTYTNAQVLNVPTAFDLTFPANSGYVYPTPLFQWNASSGAAYYKLYIDSKLFKTGIITNSYQVQSNEFFTRGIHTWYVIAYNRLGTMQSTETWSINVRSAPKGFTLVTPVNGSNTVSCNLKFSWLRYVDSPYGTASYEFHLAGYPVVHLSRTDTSYVFPTPLPKGNNSWYVIAIDSAGNPQTSGTYTFNVQPEKIFHVDGTLTYKNSVNSPLSNISLILKDTLGNYVDSTITDNTGYFVFNNLSNGKYKIYPRTNKAVGGIDPTDVLLINKYYIKMIDITDPLFLKAADVNSDNKIMPCDGLIINRYYIKLKTFFEAGQWYFQQPVFSIVCGNASVNFKAICYGDVNGSYRP